MLELQIRRADVSSEAVLRQEITPAQLSMVKLLLDSDVTYEEALRILPKRPEGSSLTRDQAYRKLGQILEANDFKANDETRALTHRIIEADNHDQWPIGS